MEAVQAKATPAHPPAVTRAPAPRLLYLDGLRGIAAAMVVLYHFWGSAGGPSWPVSLTPTVSVDLLSPIGALGGSRVSLFFVLSGFLLYLPFARRELQADDKSETLLSWLVRRLRRIALPYYAAIVLAILIVAGTFFLNELRRIWLHHLPLDRHQLHNIFASFPECLFFLHGIVPGSEMPAFNPPLWTLTPEIQLYLAFPLLLGVAQWRGFRIGKKCCIHGLGIAVALAVSASVGYRIWLYEQIGFAVRNSGPEVYSAYHCLVNTFLGRWAEFGLGMWAAYIVARERAGLPRLNRIAFLLCFGWFLILRSDLAIGGLFLAMDPAPSPLADGMGGLAFAFLILCCASSVRFARFFSWRPFVVLGTYAYSLYLIHVPILLGVHWIIKMPLRREIVPIGGSSLSVFGLNILLILPLAFLLARLFWHFFERPFLSQERQNGLFSRAICSQTVDAKNKIAPRIFWGQLSRQPDSNR